MHRHFRSFLYVLQLTVLFCLNQKLASAQTSCPGFKTFTQGGWGSTPNGNNPGTFLNNNFAASFPAPNYLTIGCTNKIRLTSAAAVRAFLPNGTTPYVLRTGTLTNPTKTNYSNVFAGQLVALALNIGFDNAISSFGSSSTNLKDLVIASGPFMGKTVQQLFDDANAKIGGCPATSPSLSQFTTALDNINKNYDNGVIKGSFLVCPLKVSCTTTSVSCFGGSNGSMTVSTTGGLAPFTYTWSASAAGNVSASNTLTAGTYTVTVQDAVGQTATTTCTVDQPATPVSASSSHTQPLCNGGSDGAISLNFGGGTAPYTVSINGGTATAQTSPASYSNLFAGTYSWEVTDANGCTQSSSEVVGEPEALTTAETHTDVNCNGGNDGSITVSFDGGTAPYTLSFNNNNPTTNSPSDINNTEIAGENPDEPKAPVSETTDITDITDISIPVDLGLSQSEENAELTVSSPEIAVLDQQAITSPVTYSNLSAGSYSWTVTDANGCTQSGSATIAQPEALSASPINNHVTCFGGTNGIVQILVSGGTAPYSVVLNGNTLTADNGSAKFVNLSAGVYNWTVTDAHGCVLSGSETITEPTAVMITSSTTSDSDCADNICDGSASVSVTGGSGSYSYSWTINGTISATQTTSSVSALCPGSVLSLLVTDATGCTATASLDTIHCINRPVAENDSTVTPPGGTIDGSLKDNDTPNPDCQNVWSLVSGTQAGTVTVQPNGDFTYVSHPTFVGTVSFTYAICDCNIACDTATVTIVISGSSNCSPLRTYTMGGWGARSNPAQRYMHANFATAFPNGITLGCATNKLKFTTPQAVTNWLPAGTSNYLLPSGTLTNPSNDTYNSNLAGQLLSATLSASFDAVDANYASGTNTLGNMYFINAPFAGMTVNQIIQEANNLIGGCGSSYTASALGTALDKINQNFDNGFGQDLGYLTCTNNNNRITQKQVSENNHTMVFPNPANTATQISVEGQVGETALIALYDLSGRLLKSQKVVLNANRSNISINVSDIKSQTCLVKITKAGQTTTTKLVVKH